MPPRERSKTPLLPSAHGTRARSARSRLCRNLPYRRGRGFRPSGSNLRELVQYRRSGVFTFGDHEAELVASGEYLAHVSVRQHDGRAAVRRYRGFQSEARSGELPASLVTTEHRIEHRARVPHGRASRKLHLEGAPDRRAPVKTLGTTGSFDVRTVATVTEATEH